MKTILLIGLGRFGRHIAMELNEIGAEVMAVDHDEAKVDSILPYVTNAQIGDSTDQSFLQSLGINNYDLCIVAIGNDFQSSLETTNLLKELGASYVVARAGRDVQAKFLLRNGADDVVYPEKQMAKWTAIRYSSNNLLDYIELDNSHSIFEVSTPPNWVGLTVGELDIRRKFKINIMAIKIDEELNVFVTPETQLTADMKLLVIGEYKALQKCFHI